MAMEVFDLDNNLRAIIEENGEVKTPDGKIVAFVNDDGSVGDLNESLLGDLSGGQAVDASEKMIGSIDQGTGSLKKGQSHWAQVVRGGEIRDKNDAHRGKVNDFTFHQFLKIAGYLFFVDQGLIQDDLPSLVAGSGSSHVPAPKPVKAQPAPVHEDSSVETITLAPRVQQINLSAPVINLAPSSTSNTQHISLAAPAQPAQNVQHINLAAPVQAPKPAIEKREYKKYSVGAFKGIEGGTKNTLEITSCDVPLSQLAIRIEKEGKDIVFKRTIMEGSTQKEQVQHFGMPYVVTKDRIKVTYAPHSDGGKLVFLITKPAPGEAQASGSAGAASGEFCRFIIPAVPGCDPTKRVSMGSAQSIDSFVFTPTGESKWETEIVGELANEGQALKFHCTVTVVEEKTKKKATQSISLPMTVSLANIETEGTKVTVYKTKTVSQASVPRAQIPIAAVGDCDIEIQLV